MGQNLSLLDSLDYAATLNDVWGYTDVQGREYALVGLTNGVSIVDIHSDSTELHEVAFVPGPASTWRDLKVWQDFAYVTTEADTGLLMIDLRQLPQRVDYRYDTLSIGLRSAHNLFIDSSGRAFIFGSNLANGGAVILDLTGPDPFQPTLLGYYSEDYIHDGYVRHDTLWSAEIYKGWIAVVDVSDPANPKRITTFSTPSNFAHNCWLSDDGTTLFTTDERPYGQVAAFAVSDLDNVEQIGRYQKDPGTGMIPHNVFFKNGYLITSYYRQGVTITDAHRPRNLVEVGWYDTSPFDPGPGFEGCWGVYPFLPSGKLLATDRQTGLYVLRPAFKRACYIEGVVTDEQGIPYPNTRVSVAGGTFTYTDIAGRFKLGTAEPGRYDVEAFRADCQGQRQSVVVARDSISTLTFTLNCSFTSTPRPVSSTTKVWWANGQLYWQPSSPLQLSVFNMQGQRVWSAQAISPGQLSTQNWRSGLYSIRWYEEGAWQSFQWVQP